MTAERYGDPALRDALVRMVLGFFELVAAHGETWEDYRHRPCAEKALQALGWPSYEGLKHQITEADWAKDHPA